jgi:catechol 2,3-dioxygenase-like lactoylglutathione lyase family enzyme
MNLKDARPVVIICTRDRAKSLPFYRDVLGLALVGEDAFAAVFALNGAEMRLSTVADWTAHAHTVFGFAVDDVAADMSALTMKGVEFEIFPGFGQDANGLWAAPDGKVRVAWFKDPDGNLLSLAQFAN